MKLTDVSNMSVDPESGKSTKKTCENVKEEFRLQNFGFGGSHTKYFVTSQCFHQKLFFPVWTTLWAVFHLVVICLQFYFEDDHPNPKWLAYLTNWGYTTLAMFSILDCVVTLYASISNEELLESDMEIPWYVKIQWILFNVSTVTAFVITVLFYTLLTPTLTANSILTHAVNSLYALSNLAICAKPVRILHVYQPVILALLYSVFSVIFHEAGGGTIYSILDWDKVQNTVLLSLGVIFIVVPLIHLVCFTIYKIRVFVSTSCCRGNIDINHNDGFNHSNERETSTDSGRNGNVA
ncbi:protein rolling stone-like [Saccostrea echinata]|uniref:protein rolling stone-like n=1 Tax=Saccostrea echinata TaxID=191078 RepID=UPI002A81BD96|nr:protein rolling stone-like [Saccostrea echinata]